jgi:serine phosphatase RsbU (regulator of sigma subunit)
MALALMLGALNQTTYFHFPLSFSVLSFTLDSSSFAALWFMMTLTISLADRSTAAQRYQERLTHELAAGATVQNTSLRSGLDKVPGMEVHLAYRPAQEVGGDFYQVKAMPTGGALVLVGDVSGKGLSAALTVSELLGAFRALSMEISEPGVILTALNKLIHARGAEGFVTACCLSLVEGKVRLANAGHLPPYLDGQAWTSGAALPLGILPGIAYETQAAQASRVLLLSDGVVEARNSQGELFGFERTAALVRNGPDALAAAAVAWGQDDDITIVELTMQP